MSTGSVHICCVWKFGDHSKALQGDQKEEFTFLFYFFLETREGISLERVSKKSIVGGGKKHLWALESRVSGLSWSPSTLLGGRVRLLWANEHRCHAYQAHWGGSLLNSPHGAGLLAAGLSSLRRFFLKLRVCGCGWSSHLSLGVRVISELLQLLAGWDLNSGMFLPVVKWGGDII